MLDHHVEELDLLGGRGTVCQEFTEGFRNSVTIKADDKAGQSAEAVCYVRTLSRYT